MANQSRRLRLDNPFKAHTRRGFQNTLKYAAWEVLNDFPQGLHISLIAEEVHQRGLRDLSRMRNATGQISSELVRAKEFFCQTESKTWRLRALDSGGDVEEGGEPQRRTQPKGDELVGHRVAVWWKGERKYFEGVIDRYDTGTHAYSVVYDDGDTDDNLKLHKYTVMYREGNIDVVTVNEHNLDDATDTTSEETKASKDVSEWSASLGQFTGSLDSTCGELSESRAQPSKRGSGRPGVNKKTNRREASLPQTHQAERMGNISIDAQSGPPVVTHGERSATTKRSHSWEDDKFSKKTRIMPLSLSPTSLRVDPLHSRATGCVRSGRDPVPLGRPGTMRHDHIITESDQTCGHTNRELPMVHTTPMATMDSAHAIQQTGFTGSQAYIASLPKEPRQTALSSALPIPIAKNETIDVLDLKRQLQPPEDRRPDLKNLDDVGPLMTLDELSDELRGMKETKREDEEVISEYREGVISSTFHQNGGGQLETTEGGLHLCVHPPMSHPVTQNSRPVDLLHGSGMESMMPPVCQRSTVSPRQPMPSTLDPPAKQPFSFFARFGAKAPVGRRHELLSPSILSTHSTVAKAEDVTPMMPFAGSIQTPIPIVSTSTTQHPITVSKRSSDRYSIGETTKRTEDKHASVAPANAADKSSLVSIALDHMSSRQLARLSPEAETGSQSTQSSRTSLKRPWEAGYSIAGV